MALKIRLRRQGRTHRPFYRLVVVDSRSPRDGRYVENLGWYNPLESEDEKNLNLVEDRIQFWVDRGAILTEKAECLVARRAPNVVRTIQEKREVHRRKKAAKRKSREKSE